MQITVSSEIENRIDDSISTSARSGREPVLISRPWVEMDMRGEKRAKLKRSKGRAHHRMEPPSSERDRAAWFKCCPQDRKSTRLNSSHVSISYAVFCLKKKNKKHSHSQLACIQC